MRRLALVVLGSVTFVAGLAVPARAAGTPVFLLNPRNDAVTALAVTVVVMAGGLDPEPGVVAAVKLDGRFVDPGTGRPLGSAQPETRARFGLSPGERRTFRLVGLTPARHTIELIRIGFDGSATRAARISILSREGAGSALPAFILIGGLIVGGFFLMRSRARRRVRLVEGNGSRPGR